MPASDLRLPVVDHSWKIFGALTVAILLGVIGAYCVWRGVSERMEPAPVEWVADPVRAASQPLPEPPPLPVAAQPFSWQDVTLMLRAGFNDEEIIAAVRGKQFVSVIGPAAVATARELGAGDKLLAFLRGQPLFAMPPVAPRVVVTAPASSAAKNVPTVAAPMDYAARDKQIKDLQRQIDGIDKEVLRLRAHPNPYSLPNRAYNDEGYAQNDESWLKKHLDQLDQQRNDLRRQKWRIEGR